jgi:hypothetical protein
MVQKRLGQRIQLLTVRFEQVKGFFGSLVVPVKLLYFCLCPVS